MHVRCLSPALAHFETGENVDPRQETRLLRVNTRRAFECSNAAVPEGIYGTGRRRKRKRF